ncbi:MAG: Coenzyme F420 hydrogenase/dehydrogenase, beta subunit C-terminal domain [Deltaproteobacteria bacterium]|nr:Coenzyme F420 hydrogenase/dehydrogenase, beta subunit C-terminal domain [Deltaproteobacteria bacterium]MBW2137982.1 Coenzyme F420 hydrogenase/dehydrogenase, beta subunit C-terminal domain [Deltaproteobacteria bacterium]
MSRTAKIEVKDKDPVHAIQTFLKEVLENTDVGGVLVAEHLPMKDVLMPALITDPEKLAGADPLAPSFPINAAKVVSKLTRRPSGTKIAVVLRPCEIRALIELVKLKQASIEEAVIIGVDCLGAYSNTNYPRFSGNEGKQATLRFYEKALSGGETAFEDFDISPACKACEHPLPENADIILGILGVDVREYILVKANTDSGESLVSILKCVTEAEEPSNRPKAIEDLLSRRMAYRDQMFSETSEATSDLKKLTAYLAGCVNCYNCRVACPVCYCKECVFATDVFDHEPVQYLRWAKRKGVLKLPTDTLFYHITRLAHMSTACVGCGQCSNACPNDIPVMEIFKTIANFTQQAFDYEAGRSIDEEPPLATFREGEFKELTGGKD